MRFYTVQDDYIKHLKSIDHRVPDNEFGDRTYVGIILEVGGFQYLAPLTSPKPHHDNIGGQDPRYFKLHEKGNPDNKLGMIRLVSMLPLAEGTYQMLDVKAQEEKYKRLLIKQILFIVSSQDIIKAKAKDLYQLVTVEKKQIYTAECDFLALENGCLAYTQATKKQVQESSANALAHARPKPTKPTLSLKSKPQIEAKS